MEGSTGESLPPLKDALTPYKVALLVIVEEHCCNLVRPKIEQHEYTDKQERELMTVLLQLVQSADLELKDLMQKLSEAANRDLITCVNVKLKEIADSGVGALMDLITVDLTDLFKKFMLHKSSVLGFFVRRMMLAYERLTFSRITKLHSAYKAFSETYQPCNTVGGPDPLDLSNLDDASMSIIEIMGDDDRDLNKSKKAQLTGSKDSNGLESGRYSKRQAEYFIAKQTALLQHNESESLQPKHLQQKIVELLSSNPDLAEAHFLSYLNNLRINEYCGAMESLYHYFDRRHLSHSTVTATATTNPGKKQEEEIINKQYRYAALNLGALHYKFGHSMEALEAIEEAIHMAQEANDHICLQHALSWLQRLGVQGTSSTAYLLDRLVTKAGELNLPHLTSLGVQAFAKHNAVSTAQPSTIFEYLVKSDIINCQHSQSDLMCVSYAQKSALWQMYGYSEMCCLNTQLMLHLNTVDLGVYHNGEAECLGLCSLAQLHALQGDFDLAFEILASTKRRFPVNSQPAKFWMMCEQRLLFERAVHSGKWSTAEQILTKMVAIDEQETSYWKCVLLKEKGEMSSAFNLLQALIDRFKEEGTETHSQLPEFLARLLMLQAEVYCGTGNPTSAGQPLLNCVSLCRKHHFKYMIAMATVYLAFVQLSLGMPHQALSLIEEVLITIMSHGGLHDRARAQHLWVKCKVAAASKTGADEKRKAISVGIQTMNDVITWHRKLGAHHKVKAAIYYQARLYHELGQTAERNKCALEFKQLDQQFPTFNVATVATL